MCVLPKQIIREVFRFIPLRSVLVKLCTMVQKSLFNGIFSSKHGENRHLMLIIGTDNRDTCNCKTKQQQNTKTKDKAKKHPKLTMCNCSFKNLTLTKVSETYLLCKVRYNIVLFSFFNYISINLHSIFSILMAFICQFFTSLPGSLN